MGCSKQEKELNDATFMMSDKESLLVDIIANLNNEELQKIFLDYLDSKANYHKAFLKMQLGALPSEMFQCGECGHILPNIYKSDSVPGKCYMCEPLNTGIDLIARERKRQIEV